MSKALKVIAATVAGFAAGILVAPKSGKETREDIKKKADEAKVVAGEKLIKQKLLRQTLRYILKKVPTKLAKKLKKWQKALKTQQLLFVTKLAV